MRVFISCLFIVATATLCNPAMAKAKAKDPVWLTLGNDGQVLARTVVASTCPQIRIDGKQRPMTARVAPGSPTNAKANTPPANQRLVCEADVSGAKTVFIGGVALKMPPANPQRIVVLGDTGCRIKTEADPDHDGETTKVQDCNSASQWPFKAVAKAAAAARPDLVVHVGDYIYRESACPPNQSADCGGSPWGDNWATWEADFFAPARSLLAAAPWIFVRGNHEICSRAGHGWFYYLDAAPYTQNNFCEDNTAARTIKQGAFQALLLDSSSAPDADPSAAQVAHFSTQLKAVSNLSNAWLLSHRPIWAVKAGEKGQRANLRPLNATLQAAWAAAPVAGVDMVVSGHTHLFELLSFAPSAARPLPPQVVVGNGGTDLAHQIKAALTGQTIGNATVASGISVDDFGYALFTPTPGGPGWQLRLSDTKGKKKLSCSIAGIKASCKP
jgi:predicted phosphodiesterase